MLQAAEQADECLNYEGMWEGDLLHTRPFVLMLSYAFDAVFLMCSLLRFWRALPKKARTCGGLCASDDEYSQLMWGRGNHDIFSYETAHALFRPTLQVLIVAPLESLLWLWPSQLRWMPFIRLVRVAPITIRKIDAFLSTLERSNSISFTVARTGRVLVLSLSVVHLLACFFVFAAMQSGISAHFASSPWMRAVNGTDDGKYSVGQFPEIYLRSGYWALISLTTVGHVDVVDEDMSRL